MTQADIDCKDEWFYLLLEKAADYAYTLGLSSEECRNIRWSVSWEAVSHKLDYMLSIDYLERPAREVKRWMEEEVGQYMKAIMVLDIICPN